MNAQQEIKDAQREWAGRPPGIPFDAKGYVDDVEANLWAPLSAHARNGYEKAAEKPLAKDMKALHSSSSLVANFFEYWTNRDDKAPLSSALCIDANGVRTLDFEKKFHTEISVKKNGGIPPHLDVGITLDSNHVVAIESKFTEPLSCATVNKSKFKPSYFPPFRWSLGKAGIA